MRGAAARALLAVLAAGTLGLPEAAGKLDAPRTHLGLAAEAVQRAERAVAATCPDAAILDTVLARARDAEGRERAAEKKVASRRKELIRAKAEKRRVGDAEAAARHSTEALEAQLSDFERLLAAREVEAEQARAALYKRAAALDQSRQLLAEKERELAASTKTLKSLKVRQKEAAENFPDYLNVWSSKRLKEDVRAQLASVEALQKEVAGLRAAHHGTEEAASAKQAALKEATTVLKAAGVTAEEARRLLEQRRGQLREAEAATAAAASSLEAAEASLEEQAAEHRRRRDEATAAKNAVIAKQGSALRALDAKATAQNRENAKLAEELGAARAENEQRRKTLDGMRSTLGAQDSSLRDLQGVVSRVQGELAACRDRSVTEHFEDTMGKLRGQLDAADLALAAVLLRGPAMGS